MSDNLIRRLLGRKNRAIGSGIDLIRFYSALGHLESATGGKRRLSYCNGKMKWPKRGVYFFFEHGESQSGSGNGTRVVRVGTHALTSSSKTTLWERLRQHRGVASTGGGNHRGSIFRELVGYALMARYPECAISTWGKGKSASRHAYAREFQLELRVSSVIGQMPFLWLWVDDPPGPQSLRGYIEKNAIALLSNFNRPKVDPSSDNWLGLYCPREKVRQSGLWNQEHVEKHYDPRFLSELENLVARHAGDEG